MNISDKGYANPDALVSTEWVAAHGSDPSIRLVESNEDILLYDVGHIPGAVKVDWHVDLNDPVVRDYISNCLLYTSPSPRDRTRSRMPSSA